MRDSKGKLITTFTSVWRLEAHGVWRIIFADQLHRLAEAFQSKAILALVEEYRGKRSSVMSQCVL